MRWGLLYLLVFIGCVGMMWARLQLEWRESPYYLAFIFAHDEDALARIIQHGALPVKRGGLPYSWVIYRPIYNSLTKTTPSAFQIGTMRACL